MALTGNCKLPMANGFEVAFASVSRSPACVILTGVQNPGTYRRGNRIFGRSPRGLGQTQSPITPALCYRYLMIRIPAMAVLLTGLAFAAAGAGPSSPDKVPSHRDFGVIRREMETLRGKTFVHQVPVFKVSEKELRAISDRELDKEFPGPKLRSYEELLAWLDMVPPHTDLKSVYASYLVDQVAGLYDSDTKEMCIPSFAGGTTNAAKKAAEKKLEPISAKLDDIVLAHEFTHALE